MDFSTERALRALADENRLRIVRYIADRDVTYAQDLLKLLDITQPTLSHHMKTLVECGLVDCEKEGRWRKYHLNGENAKRLSEELDKLFAI